ncbi:MAG TPA: hypothetical protein ENK06_07505 [Gammaproteobacteria bacterium]|nr:hypothetical protein [Gammaproteobacteria bacterium]
MKTQQLVLIISLFFIGCASNSPKHSSKQMELNPHADVSRDNVDKLYVVDCLLPGQVRALGRAANYITPRRPIKTSAIDCEIRGGEYVAFDRADYATALKIWLPQAKAGDPAAQTNVGEIYEKGMGVEPDYDFAAVWYKKAAKQGYSRAQINLGYLYEKGLGVEQNVATAMNWYRKASGLPDEVAYISSVELSAKNEELASLKEKNLALAAEAEKYKKQLRHAQQKLKNIRQDKNTTKEEISALNKQIEQLQVALKENKKHPKTQVVIKEVVLPATLPLPVPIVAGAKMPPKEVQHLIKKLNEKIKEKESDLRQQGLIIAKLSQESANFRKKISDVQQMQLASAAPNIEILDPPLSITRSSNKPSMRLRSIRTHQEIYGKVTAPAGLKLFTYNRKRVFLRPDNSFRIPVELASTTVDVKLRATDKQDKITELDFVISSPKRSAVAKPIFTSTLKRHLRGLDVGKYYALIIGNNLYKNLPNLKTAVNDARKTADILKNKYGFSTTLLINADRYTILSALHKLREELPENANLLVYYAGHGDLDKVNDRGYWLPVDADADNSANWISNVAITDMLNTMPAKHVMVIADSCYSGTMTRTAVPRIDSTIPAEIQEKWVKLMTKSRSRTVLTSGGVQPVLDEGGGGHSIFANAFLNALSNNDDILQGYALYRQVSNKVSNNSLNTQTPEYAPIKHAGHETGQFFFMPKG